MGLAERPCAEIVLNSSLSFPPPFPPPPPAPLNFWALSIFLCSNSDQKNGVCPAQTCHVYSYQLALQCEGGNSITLTGRFGFARASTSAQNLTCSSCCSSSSPGSFFGEHALAASGTKPQMMAGR